MTERCLKCGAELLPVMSYCRRCGFRRTSDLAPSEQPTATLEVSDRAVTQRFDPRPTREPGPGTSGVLSAAAGESRAKTKPRRFLFVAIVVGMLIVASICTAAIVRFRQHNRTTTSASLFYPGATTVIDMTAEGGGRAVQLETSDSLEKVEQWYQSTLKPTKTMHLTSNSIVLKNDNTTATLAFENDKTQILIKFAP